MRKLGVLGFSRETKPIMNRLCVFMCGPYVHIICLGRDRETGRSKLKETQRDSQRFILINRLTHLWRLMSVICKAEQQAGDPEKSCYEQFESYNSQETEFPITQEPQFYFVFLLFVCLFLLWSLNDWRDPVMLW